MYLFTTSTSWFQRLTPMPWTIQLLLFCIPAVDMIHKQLIVFTADKTLHMPTEFRSCSEGKQSHLTKVHWHTTLDARCRHCKTWLYSSCQPKDTKACSDLWLPNYGVDKNYSWLLKNPCWWDPFAQKWLGRLLAYIMVATDISFQNSLTFPW